MRNANPPQEPSVVGYPVMLDEVPAEIHITWLSPGEPPWAKVVHTLLPKLSI